MNIVVCMKAVPSTTEVKMDPVTNTIVRDGRQSVVNPFDSAALEEALCIKEKLGGRVFALSMGIPDTERLLRDALARGADEGLLLSDRAFAGADTLATSYALGCGIRRINEACGGIDLVLCGKMAVDGDTAQIGPELGAVLGVACITDVCEIVEIDDTLIRARRSVDDGFAVVECALPAVVTVTKDIRVPRMPSISGVRSSLEGTVEVLGAQAAGADLTRCGLNGSPTQVVRSFTPQRESEATRVVGTPQEIAEQLAHVLEEI